MRLCGGWTWWGWGTICDFWRGSSEEVGQMFFDSLEWGEVAALEGATSADGGDEMGYGQGREFK